MPRPPTVTDVTQKDSPHSEPNTAINLPLEVCSSVDEGELVCIAKGGEGRGGEGRGEGRGGEGRGGKGRGAIGKG